MKQLENHTLFFYKTCPFCVKVLLTLKSLGLNVDKKNIRESAKHKQELITGGGINYEEKYYY